MLNVIRISSSLNYDLWILLQHFLSGKIDLLLFYCVEKTKPKKVCLTKHNSITMICVILNNVLFMTTTILDCINMF
jgi:hypothetical protein